MNVSVFMGLDSAEWQAILASVLVVVTSIYVWLTWRISNASKSAAEAAERSAASSEASATAAREANVIASAIDFTPYYVVIGQIEPRVTAILLEHSGQPVYMHGVTIREARDDEGNSLPGIQEGQSLPWAIDSSGKRMRPGEPSLFTWPSDPMPEEDVWRVIVSIDYSFTEDGEHHELSTRLSRYRPRPTGRSRRAGSA